MCDLQVAVGPRHAALLTRGGEVYTWGAGNMGNGTSAGSNYPQQVRVPLCRPAACMKHGLLVLACLPARLCSWLKSLQALSGTSVVVRLHALATHMHFTPVLTSWLTQQPRLLACLTAWHACCCAAPPGDAPHRQGHCCSGLRQLVHRSSAERWQPVHLGLGVGGPAGPGAKRDHCGVADAYTGRARGRQVGVV